LSVGLIVVDLVHRSTTELGGVGVAARMKPGTAGAALLAARTSATVNGSNAEPGGAVARAGHSRVQLVSK
jgi:hypothetical protein